MNLTDCCANCKKSVINFPYFIFFFQAEDGIRDIGVTGDQTCALPISAGAEPPHAPELTRSSARLVPAPHVGREVDLVAAVDRHQVDRVAPVPARRPRAFGVERSEERRVGKECRSWWSWEYMKDNNSVA